MTSNRFVPFDNNVAQRNVTPVFPRPRDLVKIFRKHWLLIRNPFDAPGLDEELLDRILGDDEPDPPPPPIDESGEPAPPDRDQDLA